VEQIFLEASGFVDWIEEKYGIVAAWAAAVLVVAVSIGAVWIAFLWLLR
jgi:hypothetical protein